MTHQFGMTHFIYKNTTHSWNIRNCDSINVNTTNSHFFSVNLKICIPRLTSSVHIISCELCMIHHRSRLLGVVVTPLHQNKDVRDTTFVLLTENNVQVPLYYLFLYYRYISVLLYD